MKIYSLLLISFLGTTTQPVQVDIKKQPVQPTIKTIKKVGRIWIHTTQTILPIVFFVSLSDKNARETHKSGLTGLNKNTLIIATMYPAACASLFQGIMGLKKELYEPIANYLYNSPRAMRSR